MGYYIQLLEYGRVGINILYSSNRAAQLIGKLVPFPATVDTLPAELRKYSNLHLTGSYIHGQAMHSITQKVWTVLRQNVVSLNVHVT
jgi:hypothetical protein